MVVTLFKAPLVKDPGAYGMNGKDVNTLFSNVESIYEFNRSMYLGVV